MGPTYTFRAKIWVYPGDGAWRFVTLPKEYAEEIKSLTSSTQRRGFGSIKVDVKIQDERWETSIFPDTKSKSYVLPLKKEIRNKLSLVDDTTIELTVSLKLS